VTWFAMEALSVSAFGAFGAVTMLLSPESGPLPAEFDPRTR
jgi:hypothetical protein